MCSRRAAPSPMVPQPPHLVRRRAIRLLLDSTRGVGRPARPAEPPPRCLSISPSAGFVVSEGGGQDTGCVATRRERTRQCVRRGAEQFGNAGWERDTQLRGAGPERPAPRRAPDVPDASACAASRAMVCPGLPTGAGYPSPPGPRGPLVGELYRTPRRCTAPRVFRMGLRCATSCDAVFCRGRRIVRASRASPPGRICRQRATLPSGPDRAHEPSRPEFPRRASVRIAYPRRIPVTPIR